MTRARLLLVIADDFGIGPETSRGILDLAAQGRVTGTVLLVNSPYAEKAVAAWRRSRSTLDVGWHPCLTLDQPILPPEKVPSLVDGSGNFHPLGKFLLRLFSGRIEIAHIEAELRAQLERFKSLVGAPPRVVNCHHHLHVFAPVSGVVQRLLSTLEPRPYLRRVTESPRLLLQVPGGRLKRAFLTWHGKRAFVGQAGAGLPANNTLAGISTPTSVCAPNYLKRWIQLIEGDVVELTCHPGYLDQTLVGRDCSASDGRLQARVEELQHLASDRFSKACREAALRLISPSEFMSTRQGSTRHAA